MTRRGGFSGPSSVSWNEESNYGQLRKFRRVVFG